MWDNGALTSEFDSVGGSLGTTTRAVPRRVMRARGLELSAEQLSRPNTGRFTFYFRYFVTNNTDTDWRLPPQGISTAAGSQVGQEGSLLY